MATTVIDQLIVKLGLDPADFTKGEKQVAASVLKTKDQVKRANDEMGASFVSFTKKFLSAAAAIALLKKLVGALADVSTETRRLGIVSGNLRMAAADMRNFENAVEMMGGKAEEVRGSIEGLEKAVFDLTINGQMSGQLEMLARLGVQFQDNTGKARAFKDIVMDTADALERAQKNGTLNRTEAYFAARQAGFDEGTTQLILSGRGNIQTELAKQQQRHQINSEDLAAAEKIERGRAEVAQRAQSAGVQANSTAVAAAGDVVDAYNASVLATSDAIDDLGDAAERAAGAWSRYTARSMTPEQRERTYRDEVQASAKKHGVPYSILHGLIKTESNYNPDAKSAAGAVGIAQFMPATAKELGFTPGLNPKTDIDKAGQYLSTLYGIAKRRATPGEDPWALALQYYNGGIGRVARSRTGVGLPLAQETIDYPNKVLAQARKAPVDPLQFTAGQQGGLAGVMAGRGPTTVYVGPVTVATQATDAEGIASDMSGAVQRKMSAAQADTGMQ